MSHDLHTDAKSGEAAMFYVNEPPWHGLGQELSEPATAAEAIKAAHLDWHVRKVPLYACEGLNNCRVPRRYAIVPSFAWGEPQCPVFGIVGESYEPLQNAEAFGFFDPIVGQKAAVYHTAGALGEGERIWILAKLPDDIRVIGDDITHKFLLLSNSHDGESAVQIKFTPIRVVCQNTLTMALERGPTLRVAHHRDMKTLLEHADSLLGIIRTRYQAIEQAFRAMAKSTMDSKRLETYLKTVFPDPDPNKLPAARYEKARQRVALRRRWSAELFETGAGARLPGVTGTLWAAYNGVTEMVDHRDAKLSPERRLRYAWFGTGASLKAGAFMVAEEKSKVWRNGKSP